MEESNNKKSGIKITAHYKYLLILGGLILLFSLFNRVRVFNQDKIVFFAFATILYGVICWIKETNFCDKTGYTEKDLKRYHRANWILFILYVLLSILIFLI